MAAFRSCRAIQFRLRAAAAGVVAALFLLPGAAQAQYLLRPGDVLRMTIFGPQAVVHDSRIDADGMVALPLIGRLPVAGLSLDEVRTSVFEVLSAEPVRIIDPVGGDVEYFLRFSEVLVEISEFGPVYVSGVVATPGGVPYTPGMTVRQVVAQAGGLPNLELGGTELLELEASMIAERSLAARRMEIGLAQVERLQQQLAVYDEAEQGPVEPEPEPDPAPEPEAAPPEEAAAPEAAPEAGLDQPGSPPERPEGLDPEGPEADAEAEDGAAGEAPSAEPAAMPEGSAPGDEIADVGALLVEATRETGRARAEVSRELLDAMQARLDTLRLRRIEEEALVEIDQSQIERVAELRERGLIPASEQLDAQRALRTSNAQLLDTEAEVADVQAQVASLSAELATTGNVERLTLLAELERVLSALALEEAQLEAADEQLRALEGLAGTGGRTISYLLHRGQGDDATSQPVGPDEPLFPGDVIEVVAESGSP